MLRAELGQGGAAAAMAAAATATATATAANAAPTGADAEISVAELRAELPAVELAGGNAGTEPPPPSTPAPTDAVADADLRKELLPSFGQTATTIPSTKDDGFEYLEI